MKLSLFHYFINEVYGTINIFIVKSLHCIESKPLLAFYTFSIMIASFFSYGKSISQVVKLQLENKHGRTKAIEHRM